MSQVPEGSRRRRDQRGHAGVPQTGGGRRDWQQSVNPGGLQGGPSGGAVAGVMQSAAGKPNQLAPGTVPHPYGAALQATGVLGAFAEERAKHDIRDVREETGGPSHQTTKGSRPGDTEAYATALPPELYEQPEAQPSYQVQPRRYGEEQPGGPPPVDLTGSAPDPQGLSGGTDQFGQAIYSQQQHRLQQPATAAQTLAQQQPLLASSSGADMGEPNSLYISMNGKRGTYVDEQGRSWKARKSSKYNPAQFFARTTPGAGDVWKYTKTSQSGKSSKEIKVPSTAKRYMEYSTGRYGSDDGEPAAGSSSAAGGVFDASGY